MELTRRDLLKGAAALGRRRGRSRPRSRARHTPRPRRRRSWSSAQGGDISKFDPHFSTSSNDIRVSFNLFDNLTSRHPDGKLYPGLATEWKLQGQTTWTFKLRPGVKFHNGDPFTSADAKCSIERTYDPAAKTMVATVAHHHRPDRGAGPLHAGRSTPRSPTRSCPRGSPSTAARSCRRSTWSRSGNEAFNAKPVGTGPVRFVSWVEGRQGWCSTPTPTTGAARSTSTAGSCGRSPRRRRASPPLLKGEVDIITQLPPDQAERVNANASTTRRRAPSTPASTCSAVNSKRPPLDNPLVKQALSLAIDREAIVKELWRGRGIVPSGPIAKGDNHFDAELPPLAYNPKEARERLKKAGYKGEEIFIETTVAYVAQDKADVRGDRRHVEGRRASTSRSR